MDWNLIDHLAQSTSADARNRSNIGKKVNQHGWVTKEKMRQNTNEARREFAILALLLVGVSKLFSLVFGKKTGLAMMITLPLAWLASTIVAHKIGCNLGWFPLWVAVVVFLLRITIKFLGRTIGAVASFVIAIVVAFWLFHSFNKEDNLQSAELGSSAIDDVSAPEYLHHRDLQSKTFPRFD